MTPPMITRIIRRLARIGRFTDKLEMLTGVTLAVMGEALYCSALPDGLVLSPPSKPMKPRYRIAARASWLLLFGALQAVAMGAAATGSLVGRTQGLDGEPVARVEVSVRLGRVERIAWSDVPDRA